MYTEDPAEGADLAPVELAADEIEDPVDPANPPDGGDVPVPEETEDEPNPDEDLLEETPEPKKKTIPYEVFRKQNHKLRDAEEQAEAARKLAADQSREIAELKARKPEEVPAKQSNVDKAKPLIREALKDDLAKLDKVDQLIETVDKQQKQLEAERMERAEKDEERRIESTLESKEFKGKLTAQDVKNVVLKLYRSGDADKIGLAKAPYPVLIREIIRVRELQAAKKGKANPKIDAASTDVPSKAPSQKPRNRPNPADPTAWQDRVTKEFHAKLQAGEE